MSNYHLIGEDMALTVAVAGVWDGTVDPTAVVVMPAGAKNIMGVAKRIGVKGSVEKTNVKAAGSYHKQNRYHSAENSLELENFVAAAGYAIPASALGSYVYVDFSPLSGGANPFVYVGVCTEWSTDSAVATEQSVKITVDLNPDYLVP